MSVRKIRTCDKILFYFLLSAYSVLSFFGFIYICYVLYQLSQYGSLVGGSRKSLIFFLFPLLVSQIVYFLGVRAMRKKNRKQMRIFIGLLVIVIVLEFTTTVWCLVANVNLSELSPFLLQTGLKSYIAKEETSVSAWDYMQQELSCCGINGSHDFGPQKTMPFSCCGTDPTHPTGGACSIIFQKGCLDLFTQHVRYYLLYSAATAGLLFIVQIPGIFAGHSYSKYLFNELKHKVIAEEHT